MATVVLVIAVGAGIGAGAVRLTHQGADAPKRRPLTPSVVAFHFPTQGGAHPAASVDTPPAVSPVADTFVEPASARAALEDFLGAERDGLPARSFRLLSSADQHDVGSGAAWTASSADRPRPLAFTITAERIVQDGDQITVVVNRRPALDQFAGFVSARATQV